MIGYISDMGENERTVWDDVKNEANIEARKVDFASLNEVFDGRFAIVVEDKRRDYGEKRFNMLFEMNRVLLNITFTPRSPKRRIISARVASRKERRIYHAQQQNN